MPRHDKAFLVDHPALGQSVFGLARAPRGLALATGCGPGAVIAAGHDARSRRIALAIIAVGGFGGTGRARARLSGTAAPGSGRPAR